jgi:hypothetical protein
VVAGNPTCADLGLGDFEVKVDPPESGTYAIDSENSVTVTIDGLMVSWSSTIGIDAVIVKGGPNANVYTYDPEATEDSGLYSPINPSNEAPYGVSHVSFCFDYELAVSKTAETSLDRKYEWAITKAADQDSLLLAAGETFLMGYKVQVTQTSSSDSNWAVSGTITVHNPSPYPAIVAGVTDVIDDFIAADVDCGVEFPFDLAPHSTLTCTYSAALPNGNDRTNVATAETEDCDVDGGSGSAAVSFADPTVNHIDDCVDVTDTLAGDLGTVCVGDAGLFEYEIEIGPYEECGSHHEVVNTASFDCDGSNGSASATVTVDIADCDYGCTLTQGYWKTHSEHGPAPYDDTWAQLENGADTPFFLSGQSWLEVFRTAPRGDAYYNLAHQYMAAVLNGLNGADQTAVAEQLAAAATLFEAYSPGTLSGSVRKSALVLALALDQYNNGVTGPGHCDE